MILNMVMFAVLCSIYEEQLTYPSARLEISFRSESTVSNKVDTSAALSSFLLIS